MAVLPACSARAHGSPLAVSERTITAVDRYLRDVGPLSVADGIGVIGEVGRRTVAVLGVDDVLTFSSGTAAPHVGYLALDLPLGSTVIGPVNTFQASPSPAMHVGLNVGLVDVDPEIGMLRPRPWPRRSAMAPRG